MMAGATGADARRLPVLGTQTGERGRMPAAASDQANNEADATAPSRRLVVYPAVLYLVMPFPWGSAGKSRGIMNRLTKALAASAVVILCVLFLSKPPEPRHPRNQASVSESVSENGVAFHPSAVVLQEGSSREASVARSGGGKPGQSVLVHEAPHQAPAWTVKFGGEFWRTREPFQKDTSRVGAQNRDRSADLQSSAAPQTSPLLSFDVDELADRVSHAFRLDESSGTVMSRSRYFEARVGQEGLRFRPAREKPDSNFSAPGAEARIRTASIQQSGGPLVCLDGHSIDVSIVGNTAQRLLSREPTVVEHVEARAEGVSLTWVIDRPFARAGSVTVEAEFAGLAHAGESSAGHHFADERGVRRMRVGSATAVDAAGQRWPLGTTWTGQSLAVNVPSEVLADAAYPLAIDPLIGPEFPMSEPQFIPRELDYGFEPGPADRPSVACSSEGCIIAWNSRFTRVRADGTLIDLASIPYGIQRGGSGIPPIMAVASGDEGYLLVWQDRAESAVTSRLFGAIVPKEDPWVVDAGFPVSEYLGIPPTPAVAWNGREFLAVWVEGAPFSGITRLVGKRIQPSGKALDENPTSICTVSRSQCFPKVASDGDGFLVVWEDLRNQAQSSYDIYGARVTADGKVLDPDGFPIAVGGAAEAAPSVAFNGADYLVVWQDFRSGKTYDIYGSLIGRDSKVLPRAQIPISTADVTEGSPSVSSLNGEFLVTWESWASHDGDERWADVWAARVGSSGDLIDAEKIIISDADYAQTTPSVSASQGSHMLTWLDYREGNRAHKRPNIRAIRIDPTGSKLDKEPNIVSIAATPQTSPSVAFNGKEFLVVWQETVSNWFDPADIRLRATRIDGDGKVIIPSGFEVAAFKPGSFDRFPAVAAREEDFLIAWVTRSVDGPGSILHGARVRNGAVLDREPIEINRKNDYYLDPPAVTSNGEDWLVCSRVFPGIFGSRIDRDGRVLTSSAFTITAPSGSTPSVASSGGNYLITWDEWDAGEPSVAYVTVPSGNPDFQTGVQRFPKTKAQQRSVPVVVASKSGYLLGWAESTWLNSESVFIGEQRYLVWHALDSNGIQVGEGRKTLSGPFYSLNTPPLFLPSSEKDSPFSYLMISPTDWEVKSFTAISIDSRAELLDSQFARIPALARFPVMTIGRRGNILQISSAPRLGSTRVVGNFISTFDPLFFKDGKPQVNWFSEPGKRYRVQFTPSLTSPAWRDLPGDIVADHDTAFKTDDSASAAPERFYRVVEVP